MTKEQMMYRASIVSDLRCVEHFMNSNDKQDRLLSAYHAQQAIEKTIKLKAGIKGLNLWGHNIKKLLDECDRKRINIGVPSNIRKKAVMYTSWEAECRYMPAKVVRRDSISNAYKECMAWLNSGDTQIPI